jgi:hypothetical protein
LPDVGGGELDAAGRVLEALVAVDLELAGDDADDGVLARAERERERGADERGARVEAARDLDPERIEQHAELVIVGVARGHVTELVARDAERERQGQQGRAEASSPPQLAAHSSQALTCSPPKASQ